MNGRFVLTYGCPLKGEKLEKTRLFLDRLGLKWDNNIEFTVNITENGNIVGTGSRRENILECFGVAKDYQGEGLTATLLSELMKNAHENGSTHLFIFTKPESSDMFMSLGFYSVAATKHVALLEDKKDGVKRYVASLGAPSVKNAGAIVMNCNPFTNGHLYLITTAAKLCDHLFIFVVSEDKSYFTAQDRLAMVKEGTAHLSNISVCPSGPYLISSATFPSYFLKETVKTDKVNCELDLTVFSDCFAKPLGIATRYVGTEPNDPVTAAYNAQMKRFLPEAGVAVIEIPRLETGGLPVSASNVRRYIKAGDLAAVESLVPSVTLKYVNRKMGK